MSNAIIQLAAHKGDQLLVSRDLAPGEYPIGRDPACPIHIESPEVSRAHAKLTVTTDRIVLEDIGGKFGTLIDGRQIAGPVSLQPGQSFTIGKTVITLQAIAAPAAAAPDLPGRYERVRHLAKGGMGEIHLAHDQQLQRHVALKVMTPKVAASPGLARRFTQEALVLGRLDHPHIVPIHDLGTDAAGQNFYAMKYVRGTTLKDVLNGLRQGQANVVDRYPLHQLLRIYQKICDAVAYAHAKGIIHRDLKPANIMLGEYGEVFVMDWGLAKILNQPEEAPATVAAVAAEEGTGTEGGTRYGTVMGTPGFMAPEQAEGRLEAINQRTDIYSLGAILYHILTLRAPFTGGGPEVLAQVKAGQITPPAKLADQPNAAVLVHCPERRVPEALAAVAMEALACDPAKRYPAVEALQRDIAAWQSGYAPRAEHAGRLRQFRLSIRRNGPLAAAASIIVLLGVALGWQHLRHQHHRSEDAARLQRTAPICHQQAGDLIAQGNFAGALPTARLAHELDPLPAHAHRLARVHLALMQPAKAKAVLKSMDEPHPFGARALKLCDQLIRDFGQGALPLHAMGRVHRWQTQQRLTPDARHTAALMEREKLAVWQRGTAAMRQIGLTGRLQRDGFGYLKVNLSGTQTRDLKPFAGLPVSSLNLWRTRVDDLRPVAGMPLNELYLAYTAVDDLQPLAGRPLQSLTVAFAPVADLKPLQGMPLVYLHLSGTKVKDLAPLKGMPLRALHLDRTPVASIRPLAGLPLKELRLDGCKNLRDLTALSQCTNLEVLVLPREHGAIGFLRNLPKLKRLSYHYDRDASKMETVDQFFRTRQLATRR